MPRRRNNNGRRKRNRKTSKESDLSKQNPKKPSARLRLPNLEDKVFRKLKEVKVRVIGDHYYLSLRHEIFGILKDGEEVSLLGTVKNHVYPDGSVSELMGIEIERVKAQSLDKIKISDCFLDIEFLSCQSRFFRNLKERVLLNKE